MLVSYTEVLVHLNSIVETIPLICEYPRKNLSKHFVKQHSCGPHICAFVMRTITVGCTNLAQRNSSGIPWLYTQGPSCVVTLWTHSSSAWILGKIRHEKMLLQTFGSKACLDLQEHVKAILIKVLLVLYM